MAIRDFLVYSEQDDEHSFWLWRAGLPTAERARIDRYVRSFSNVKMLSLPFEHLKYEGGIWEFKFKVNKVQHRAFGFAGPGKPGQLEFTFLIGSTKKTEGAGGDPSWEPPGAIGMAKARMNTVKKDRSYVQPYRFDPPTTH
jgi:hypothetical protein